LFLAYAAVLTVPSDYYPIEIGLDSSHQFASNYFAASNYKYGTDIIFTYGPLGFLDHPEDIGHNFLAATSIRLLVWVFLFAKLAVSYHSEHFPRWAIILVVLSLIAAHPVLNFLFDYMLAITAVLLCIYDPPEEQSFWWVTIPASILLSVAFLLKYSTFTMVLGAFAVYFVITYIHDRRRPSVSSLLRLGFLLAAPVIAYLIYNPSFSGLWRYVVNATRVANGYSDAMSTLGLPDIQYPYLGLLIVLLGGFGLGAVGCGWLAIEDFACIGVAFFIGIKHSVVRADAGHLTFVYALAVILFALTALKCVDTWKSALTSGVIWLAICVLGVIAMDPIWGTLSAKAWDPEPHLAAAKNILYWHNSWTGLATQTQAILVGDRLPAGVLANLRRGPVIVFPWELSYGPANGVDLIPLYTVQAYTAYTHELDKETASHLIRAPGSAQLLLEWNSIDDRHLLLDTPATWRAIYSSFEAELAEAGYILLRKRDRPLDVRLQPLSHSTINLRLWNDLPDHDYLISASIKLSPTLLGICRHLLYKTNPVYMELQSETGQVQRFRVVPDVLQEPIILNCLPLNHSALESLLFSGMCEQKIKRFRFSGDGLRSFANTAAVEFYSTPGERGHFGPHIGNGWENIVLPPDISAALVGNIDSLDDKPLAGLNDADHPTRIASGDVFNVAGWAASGAAAGEAFDAVFVVSGEHRILATKVPRPDVAKYFKNPKLAQSGFQASVDTAMLGKGLKSISLVGVLPDGTFYRGATKLVVLIE
jgi:hypothetical protein